jgi:hypothetical protein
MSPTLRQLNPRIHVMPAVPKEFDKVYKAKNPLEPQTVYKINLFHNTCTCPEFLFKTQRYPNNDIRAVCPHIVDKLKYVKLYQTYDSLTANLLHCSVYLKDDIFVECEIAGNQYVITSSQQSQWVNVHIVPSSKPIKGMVRFGYDTVSNTWQSDEPKDALRVEQYILSLL